MKLRMKIFTLVLMTFFGLVSFVVSAQASTTNGTIDATNKYAWSNQMGWINFGVTNSSIAITDTAVTGYAWSEDYGWINMAPTNSGVTNDNEGNLSGSAWGANIGWIDFSSVIINSSGEFTGTATGDTVGTINFDCTNCSVTTDWRPASSRTAAAGGGGGGFVSNAAPFSYSISINNGDSKTNSLTVDVYFKGDVNTKYVWLGEKSDLSDALRYVYSPTNDTQILSYSFGGGDEGIKTVYSKFCNTGGVCGSTVSASIEYTIKSKEEQKEEVIDDKTDPEKTEEKDKTKKTVTETIKDLISKIDLLIPDALKIWKAKEKEKVEDVRQYVSTTTPLSMRGNWNYLDKRPIIKYVFDPLPDEFKALAKKFPSISNLFKETNINSAQDLRKLVDAKITVPSLREAIGLPFHLPINQIPKEQKDKLPTEMVFSQGVGQLIDFGTILSLSSDGLPQQKLRTISGKKIHLSVKPEFSAKSVKGYITFSSREVVGTISNNKFARLSDYIKLAQPVRASSNNAVIKNISVEEKMVVASFEYVDDDKDGIYTAEVYSPVSAGSYEILTVIDYIDDVKGNKIIKLVTVVDPEGYVYEKVKGKELRISNAVVALYAFDPTKKKFEMWDAEKYQQKNSQITGARGSYSFLVPPGTYYLTASAPGYDYYTSAIFKVSEGVGVHMNVELQSKSWWIISWDVHTWIIIVMGMIVLYLIEREVKVRLEKRKKK